MTHSKNTAEKGIRPGFPRVFEAVAGMAGGNGNGPVPGREDLLVLSPRTETRRPPFYRVIMLNDDYTPMDFVISVLEQIFRQPHSEAVRITMEIHHRGAGACGVFTRDVAETKIEQVVAWARKSEFPLQCVMEKE